MNNQFSVTTSIITEGPNKGLFQIEQGAAIIEQHSLISGDGIEVGAVFEKTGYHLSSSYSPNQFITKNVVYKIINFDQLARVLRGYDDLQRANSGVYRSRGNDVFDELFADQDDPTVGYISKYNYYGEICTIIQDPAIIPRFLYYKTITHTTSYDTSADCYFQESPPEDFPDIAYDHEDYELPGNSLEIRLVKDNHIIDTI